MFRESGFSGVPTSFQLAEGYGAQATKVDLVCARPRSLRVWHVSIGHLHGNREASMEPSPRMVRGTAGAGKQSDKLRLVHQGVVHGRSTREAGELGVTPLEPVEGRDRG